MEDLETQKQALMKERDDLNREHAEFQAMAKKKSSEAKVRFIQICAKIDLLESLQKKEEPQ